MFAGELRHYVTIQTPTFTQDAAGGPTITWGTYANVWASIEPLKGNEYLQAKVQSEVETRIRIRALDGVEEKMRVLWTPTTYEIVTVINVFERDQEMQLMCKKVE